MDLNRMRQALGGPNTAWILERVRQRLERGLPATGTVVLTNPTSEQRSALDRLFGRVPSGGASLAVDLERLEKVLRDAEICQDLTEAVTALTGPIQDIKAVSEAHRQAWAQLFAEVQRLVADRAELSDWLLELRDLGLVRRLSGGDLIEARRLLTQAIDAARRLPAQGIPLAQLAAAVTGDSHALDGGQPLGTLVLRAAARIGGIEQIGDEAQDQRDAWAAAGVACDELGVTVLLLNLPGAGTGLTDDVMRRYCGAGQPLRLTLRDLLRQPPSLAPSAECPTVFVCENRTIVTAVADALGTRSAPLVCSDGQPSSAVRMLLKRISAAGFSLRYHGDFDWGGVRIANLHMRRHGARPWRYKVEDYVKAAGAGTTLKGIAVAADWDPRLEATMTALGRAVHEEQVVDQLIRDLALGLR